MAKILYVEDDPILGKTVASFLEGAGHAVTWSNRLDKARVEEAKGEFDLFLFDVNLPDGSGFELCHELRQAGSRLPILMLTAMTDENSVVGGFESGANDYIKKPFNNRELLVRIQSHLKEPFVRDEQIKMGPITVLLNQRRVMIDSKDMEFNRREFDVFTHLVKNPGVILSREQIIAALMSGDNILDRTIDSHFSHIRTKLKSKGVTQVQIRSVYGVGYRLEVA